MSWRKAKTEWIGAFQSDQPTLFTVDTGLGGLASGMLQSAGIDRLIERGDVEPALTPVTSVGPFGREQSRIVRAPSLRVGEDVRSRVTFREGPINTLGLNYLSRYAVVLDFANEHLYLKKGSAFEAPERMNMSGLQLARKDGRTTILDVAERGPGFKCGLHPGDRMLEIDGANVDAFSLIELADSLSNRARRAAVMLRIERDGVVRDFELTLSDWQERGAHLAASPSGTRGQSQ